MKTLSPSRQPNVVGINHSRHLPQVLYQERRKKGDVYQHYYCLTWYDYRQSCPLQHVGFIVEVGQMNGTINVFAIAPSDSIGRAVGDEKLTEKLIYFFDKQHPSPKEKADSVAKAIYLYFLLLNPAASDGFRADIGYTQVLSTTSTKNSEVQ